MDYVNGNYVLYSIRHVSNNPEVFVVLYVTVRGSLSLVIQIYYTKITIISSVGRILLYTIARSNYLRLITIKDKYLFKI